MGHFGLILLGLVLLGLFIILIFLGIRMGHFRFTLLSLFIIFLETMITISSISSGFLVTIFSSGLFLIIFMMVLGYFEFTTFFAMEDRTWFDWILFILCLPSVLFFFLLTKLGILAIKWADSVSYSSTPTKKSGSYKVTTDSNGTTEIIVDKDGNKVTRVDSYSWDGSVYGSDGNKYVKK